MTQQTTKIGIILGSDDHEKVQMAGMITSVAAVSGISVSVFIAMGAIRKFRKGISEDEKFSGGSFSQVMRTHKVPPYLELFEQGKEFGDVKIFACALATELLALQKEDIADVIDDIVGVTKFLVESDGSQLLYL